jgi:hypothetical protein
MQRKAQDSAYEQWVGLISLEYSPVKILLFFRDTDLRRALDIAHRDRHRVGYLAICWFEFQYVSTLRKGRDSACQHCAGSFCADADK